MSTPRPTASPSAATSAAAADYNAALAALQAAQRGAYTWEEIQVFSAVKTGKYWVWMAAQAADEVKAADLRHTTALGEVTKAPPVFVAYKLENISPDFLTEELSDMAAPPRSFATPQAARAAIDAAKPYFLAKYNEIPLFLLTQYHEMEDVLQNIAAEEASMSLEAIYNANIFDLPELANNAAAHFLAAEVNENMQTVALTIRRD